MCIRMIFAAVLSPTIKIFHRHLGPNLYIFAVKVPQTFYGDFMTFHREKNTDQGDFVLKIAVRTVRSVLVEDFVSGRTCCVNQVQYESW
jgi:hypothetical protein